MRGVSLDVSTGRFAGTAQLRALTRVGWNGDTVVCLPEHNGELDMTVWTIHSQMVDRAQTQRAELFKAAVAAAAALLDTVKSP
jgi:hypothetical protein